MKVLKFGGTSIGSAARMQAVANLVCDGNQNIVVLSAMSGTTNALIEICNYLTKANYYGALEVLASLEEKYYLTADALFVKEDTKQQAKAILKSQFDYIRSFTKDVFTLTEEKIIIAQGELLSTTLFRLFLNEKAEDCLMISALDIIKTDINGEPDTVYIAEKLNKILNNESGRKIYLTQGFICRNVYGEVDNLDRGGSDYTASLIGAAVQAEEIQIWTDIDGMHNNDPRIVENTRPIPFLHFEEAAELAYFGAKILHPTCILPAKLNNIPVRLLNTMQPEAPGTLISTHCEKGKIEAVAAKDGIIAIKIKSGRMLLAHGFLRKIFEVFELYRTPIDMITTSEVGVSVTIDNPRHLDEIITDLKQFGTISVDKNMVIICVVGDMPYENEGFQAKIVGALHQLPIRMISYGGSDYNISFLIHEKDKKQALNALSNVIFN
jgi:aspartate kinase